MRILGIESSCDETSAAVIADGRTILSNIVATQVEIHARYGGVVPEVASRQHVLSIIPVISEAMAVAGTGWDDIDAVAVTSGPGLAGSLLVGVNTAKAIAMGRGLPLVGINHLEGHIYANWLTDDEPEFPLLCLVVSGGHSDLVLMRGHGDYALLGRTRDDAAGEAFDKAARILGLGYPGGPAIEKAAKEGEPKIKMARAWIKGSDDFSFSGVKTELLRLVEKGVVAVVGEPADGKVSVADAASSFQAAVTDVLTVKTAAVARKHRVRQVLLAGGVAANGALRQRIKASMDIKISFPPLSLCTDNAAMIAAAACFRYQKGQTSPLSLDVIPGLKLA
jgi:tRNA N6-adenosine threonylcarbamoyltransferase